MIQNGVWGRGEINQKDLYKRDVAFVLRKARVHLFSFIMQTILHSFCLAVVYEVEKYKH